MKNSFAILFLLLSYVTGFSSTTWILHGKKYQVDTLYHAYIGPGTTQTSLKLEGPVKFRIFYTTTDLKNKNVDVRGIKHTDKLNGLGTVSEAIKTHSSDKRNYFAGVNADFFSGTSPCGITVIDREVYSSAQSGGWYLFGMNENRRPMVGTGELALNVKLPNGENFNGFNVNRKRGVNELVLYTPRIGNSTKTDGAGTEVAVIPIDGNNKLAAGKTVKMQVTCSPVSGTGSMQIPLDGYILSGNGTASDFLKKMRKGDIINVRCAVRFNGITGGVMTQALGGCPQILANGNVLDTENVLDHLNTAQPRTAVGYNKQLDKLVILVADGRSSISVGPISKVLADMMKCTGCDFALNFDGGGSSELYIKGLGVRNVVTDGHERKVTNGLYLSTDTPKDNEIAQIRFEDYTKKLSINEKYIPKFYGYNKYGVLVDTNLSGVQLNTTDGKSFTSGKSGCFNLIANYGNLSASIVVTVGTPGGVNQVEKDSEILCFPNPINQGENLNIKIKEESQVNIFDISGHLLYSGHYDSDASISTANLIKGIYLVQLKSSAESAVIKVIVK